MDKREFWSTKNPGPQLETVEFSHPSFTSTFRMVANVFADVILAGNVYTPAPMTIGKPERNADAQPRLTITFPRAVVGRQFKQQLALVLASGSRAPIAVAYKLWLQETDAPKVTWNMYASDKGGIRFSPESVQVVAGLDNPMTRFVAPIYDPAVFTGLQAL